MNDQGIFTGDIDELTTQLVAKLAAALDGWTATITLPTGPITITLHKPVTP